MERPGEVGRIQRCLAEAAEITEVYCAVDWDVESSDVEVARSGPYIRIRLPTFKLWT